MKKRIAIIGSGDLGRQLGHFLSERDQVEVVGYFDDYATRGSVKHNHVIIGGINEARDLYAKDQFDSLIMGIGYKHLKVRDQIFNDLSQDIPFETYIHKSCIVDETAVIENGAILYPGCIIDQRVRVGANTLLNLGVVVAHDSTIGQSNFIAPSVSIAGYCRTGSCVFVGVRTALSDNVEIAPNVFIGAGSLVLKSIFKEGKYVGSPVMNIA